MAATLIIDGEVTVTVKRPADADCYASFEIYDPEIDESITIDFDYEDIDVLVGFLRGIM